MSSCTMRDKSHTYVSIKTDMGEIVVKLYNDTPQHRDNFVKLVNSGYYDGLLFHRVIKDFMIQGGDPDSRQAKPRQALGSGGPGYTIPAEFVSAHFHKKGALAAARQGDHVNPEKKSSGSQFYIVTGAVFSEGQLASMEQQLTRRKEESVFQSLVAAHREEIMQYRRSKNHARGHVRRDRGHGRNDRGHGRNDRDHARHGRVRHGHGRVRHGHGRVRHDRDHAPRGHDRGDGDDARDAGTRCPRRSGRWDARSRP